MRDENLKVTSSDYSSLLVKGFLLKNKLTIQEGIEMIRDAEQKLLFLNLELKKPLKMTNF